MTTFSRLVLIAAALSLSLSHAGAKPTSKQAQADDIKPPVFAFAPADDVKPPVFAFAPAKVTETRALVIEEQSEPLASSN